MDKYEHLRGKVIPVKNAEGLENILVVDLEFDIGITIVNTDDHNQYISCLQGPVAKRMRKQIRLNRPALLINPYWASPHLQTSNKEILVDLH